MNARPVTAMEAAAEGVAARIKAMAERPQSLTLAQLIERFMLQYCGRDRTIGQRLDTWRFLLGDFTLEKIDSELIYAARAELATLPPLTYKGKDIDGKRIFKPKKRQRAKSGSTINKYMSALGTLFTWAIAERLAPRGWAHPCRGIKRKPEAAGRVRFLDEAERARLFVACKASQYPRMFALVLTAMLTGARRGELLGLKWCDVDLANARAYLGRSKNGDRRTLVLLPQVVDALSAFGPGEPDRHVFGSVRSRQHKPASIDTAWRHAIARAKIDNFRFHDLRHCCASYMAQAGAPLNVIAEVLGHRKLDMARRYAHLTTQTKAAAMVAALGSIGVGPQ